jgi:hypothetical protein
MCWLNKIISLWFIKKLKCLLLIYSMLIVLILNSCNRSLKLSLMFMNSFFLYYYRKFIIKSLILLIKLLLIYYTLLIQRSIAISKSIIKPYWFLHKLQHGSRFIKLLILSFISSIEYLFLFTWCHLTL